MSVGYGDKLRKLSPDTEYQTDLSVTSIFGRISSVKWNTSKIHPLTSEEPASSDLKKKKSDFKTLETKTDCKSTSESVPSLLFVNAENKIIKFLITFFEIFLIHRMQRK